MRYFITLQYDGTNYHGWQIQPNAVTVEETLETALLTLLQSQVDVVGAGRTDAGVHASMMVCHFDYEEKTIDCEQLAYRLNRLLPNDISICKIEELSGDMHARFSAKSRTYCYRIHTHKDVFMRQYSYFVTYKLDFDRMNEACLLLKRHHDFKAFCKAGSDVKTTECEIYEAKWIQNGENCYHFTITANRFLRNMVRAIVGTLIDVGRGNLSLSEFEKLILNGTRSDAGESVPAHALFLADIKY